MTTLKETVRIHSPLDKVYAIAEDCKRWDSWWVGCREERITWGAHSTSLALLVPFPLTQRVLEDRIDADRARWRVRSEGSAESRGIDPEGTLVQLGANQMWTYEACQSGTEITVEIDYRPPRIVLQHGLQETLARMEDECVKKSLDNLRQLCEAA